MFIAMAFPPFVRRREGWSISVFLRITEMLSLYFHAIPDAEPLHAFAGIAPAGKASPEPEPANPERPANLLLREINSAEEEGLSIAPRLLSNRLKRELPASPACRIA
jgi:hypothetical protein